MKRVVYTHGLIWGSIWDEISRCYLFSAHLFEMDCVQRLVPGISKEIQCWIDEGKTFQEISDTLQGRFPSVMRGLSARSLRRFCRNHSIQKRKGAELDSIVSDCINEVSTS